MTIRVRPFITAGMLTAALLVAGCGDGGGEGDETQSTEPTTQATEPALTAPPTQTPEEEAEAAIKETFAGIIAARDEFNANADEYSRNDVMNGNPVSTWRVTGGGKLEMMSQAEIWLSSELNSVGETAIANHDVAHVDLQGSGDIDDASSTACLDLSGFTFTTYEGEPSELSFEPDPSQIWKMEWTFRPDAAPEHGLEEAGWYLSELEIERGKKPC